jgi:2-hydroxy-3-keto-5-methylthiopentenyl-1-phosphate phosphatase
MLPRPIIVCDFDGTITLSDVTDLILERMAAPEWRRFEQMWSEGRIGSRECLEQQLALVETSPKTFNALVDSIPVDPGFAGFCRFVQKNAVPFVIVSDGLDYVIRRVLRRCGVQKQVRNGTHFFSSAVRLHGGRLSLRFPHALASCSHGCATCKPLIIQQLRGHHWPVLYVGDGLSDRHAVGETDFVYARPALLNYCRKEGIPSGTFRTFEDVECGLAQWLGGEAPLQMDEAARMRLASNPDSRGAAVFLL